MVRRQRACRNYRPVLPVIATTLVRGDIDWTIGGAEGTRVLSAFKVLTRVASPRCYDRCRKADPRNNRSPRNCNWHGGDGQSEVPAFFETRKSDQAMTP